MVKHNLSVYPIIGSWKPPATEALGRASVTERCTQRVHGGLPDRNGTGAADSAVRIRGRRKGYAWYLEMAIILSLVAMVQYCSLGFNIKALTFTFWNTEMNIKVCGIYDWNWQIKGQGRWRRVNQIQNIFCFLCSLCKHAHLCCPSFSLELDKSQYIVLTWSLCDL